MSHYDVLMGEANKTLKNVFDEAISKNKQFNSADAVLLGLFDKFISHAT